MTMPLTHIGGAWCASYDSGQLALVPGVRAARRESAKEKGRPLWDGPNALVRRSLLVAVLDELGHVVMQGFGGSLVGVHHVARGVEAVADVGLQLVVHGQVLHLELGRVEGGGQVVV